MSKEYTELVFQESYRAAPALSSVFKVDFVSDTYGISGSVVSPMLLQNLAFYRLYTEMLF